MKTIALVLAGLAAACGGDDDGSPLADAAGHADADPSAPDARIGPDGQPVSFSSQIIANDCAPNDGPALRILLTDDAISAQCRAAGTGQSVEIRLYTREISAPQTIQFNPGNFAGNGSHCLGGAAPCRISETGEVQFDSYQVDVGASGTFRLELQGSAIEGRFDASWCDPTDPLICG